MGLLALGPGAGKAGRRREGRVPACREALVSAGGASAGRSAGGMLRFPRAQRVARAPVTNRLADAAAALTARSSSARLMVSLGGLWGRGSGGGERFTIW